MTCIVGLVDDGKVFIGGDSCASTGYVEQTLAFSKVFRQGDFLIGYSGSVRMLQLLQYAFTPPERPADMSVERYFTTLFIDELRNVLKDKGHAYKQNEQESTPGYFLIGYQGRLFTVSSDYSLAEMAEGFNAIGSGDEVALGALFATRSMSLIPQKRIELALAAAAHFCRGVGEPFHVECLEEVKSHA